MEQTVDVIQTLLLVGLGLVLIYVVNLLRVEIRRTHAFGHLIGEQTDLKRRVEDLEEDVARLTMEAEKNDNRH